MVGLVVLWVVSAMVIGFLGRNLRFRFWGYFFVSILLTPVIGLLMLIAAIPPKEEHDHRVARR